MNISNSVQKSINTPQLPIGDGGNTTDNDLYNGKTGNNGKGLDSIL